MHHPQITANCQMQSQCIYACADHIGAGPKCLACILSVLFKAHDQNCINCDRASHSGFQQLTFADGTISRVTRLADAVVPTHGVETERIFITVVLVCYTFVML